MTLEDRGLREHLDRRADAGVVDPADIAVAVVEQSGRVPRLPWWRSRAARFPAFGLAAALLIAVLGVALLPGRLAPGPGGTASPSVPIVSSYPGERALTTDELFAAVLDEPVAPVDTLLIADVSLIGPTMSCPIAATPPCNTLEIRSPAKPRAIQVHAGRTLVGNAPYAFRVGLDFSLDLVGSVQSGPDTLAWTMGDVGSRIAELRSSAATKPTSFLVSAWLWSVGDYRRCLLEGYPPPSRPDFAYPCGQSRAFLAPDNTQPPVPSWGAIADSWLRLPNSVAEQYASMDGPIQGFWLIDFSLGDAECDGCSSLGGATLVGRVLPLGGPDPSGTATAVTPTPAPSGIAVNGITFSTESVTLDGFETADVEVTVDFSGAIQDDATDMGGGPTPSLCLRRTSPPPNGAPSSLTRELIRDPGTNTFRATFRMAASGDGQWVVGCLTAIAPDFSEFSVDPAQLGLSPTLTVAGTHQPRLTMTFAPSPAVPGQPVTVTGQLTDDTGTPLAGQTVTIGRDNVCAEGGPGTAVQTDATGRYSYRIDQADAFAVCALVSDQPGSYPRASTSAPVAIFASLFGHPIP